MTRLVHSSGQRCAQELMAHQGADQRGPRADGRGRQGRAGCRGSVWLAGKVLMSALGRDLEARQNQPLKGAQRHSRRLQEVERCGKRKRKGAGGGGGGDWGVAGGGEEEEEKSY